MSITILGIESSCDDTSAAIIRDKYILSNVIASQAVHKEYGGVVPELASRAHQQNIIPVVDKALKSANLAPKDIDAIAFTRGPGLLGSLLVGTSFAKGFALANDIPLIEVNHLQGHVLAHFIHEMPLEDLQGNQTVIEQGSEPNFPFITLLVSGGHTQLILIKDHFDMEILGETIDDAAGEAFDKCAKVIGLPYPGGPVVDRLAQEGDKDAFKFNRPKVGDLEFSFSGLKTSFLYTVRDELKKNPNFVEERKADLCASLQYTIIDILLEKVKKAVEKTGVREIAIGGGVAANSGLRNGLQATVDENGWKVHIPPRKFTTDNAAMIAIAGYFKYKRKEFVGLDVAPMARMPIV